MQHQQHQTSGQHDHSHSHAHAHNTDGNINVAFFLNLAFTIFEFVGGFVTNSVAIMADAVHDLGDSCSLGMAWYLQRYAQKGRDASYAYGYRRFSLLGALITGVVLIVGTFVVLSETIPRLMDPEPTNAPGMVLFAVVGVLVNGAAVLRLRGSHGLNAQMVAWHLLEDVLGWVAVLVASVVLLFSDFYLLDPLLSVLITLYVLYNTGRNLRKTLVLFLQAIPEHINQEQIEHTLQKISGVQSTHHTHIWSLDGENHVLTTHLVVPPDASKAHIVRVREDTQAAVEDLNLEHLTIQIEYADEPCAMRPDASAEHEETTEPEAEQTIATSR
jgi:cobalt-zinc-cadmium efflux system protein